MDTNEQYHADTTHISKSGLDLIARSPLHYWHRYLNPDRESVQSKKHFIVGTISHLAVLEPEYLSEHYFILDRAASEKMLNEIGGAKPQATNRYKDWLALQKSLNPNKDMIDVETYDQVSRMRDAVHAHEPAAFVLKDGFCEKTFTWKDFDTGAPCKIRPDKVNDVSKCCIDLKFMQDASFEAFSRAAYDHRYFVQGAFYTDGLLENDISINAFYFVVVEKEPPHPVQVFYLDKHDQMLGRKLINRDLKTYMKCLETGEWPGYSDNIIQTLRLPEYAYKRL